MGLVTDDLRAAALKYGHDNVAGIDATFATNHLKFPLYTALVLDDHGNGLPIFEVPSESTAQLAITEWMVAYKQYIQAYWHPSCHLADDAQGEINAIRRLRPFSISHKPVDICMHHAWSRHACKCTVAKSHKAFVS